MASMSQIITLKTFFGFKPNQTLKEFSEEVKTLSDSEKQSMAQFAKEELIKTGTHTAEDFNF